MGDEGILGVEGRGVRGIERDGIRNKAYLSMWRGKGKAGGLRWLRRYWELRGEECVRLKEKA